MGKHTSKHAIFMVSFIRTLLMVVLANSQLQEKGENNYTSCMNYSQTWKQKFLASYTSQGIGFEQVYTSKKYSNFHLYALYHYDQDLKDKF